MKTKIIRLGTSDRFDQKYMDGRIDLHVLELEGNPDTVAKAEKIRYDVLRECADGLYEIYVSSYSMSQLDALFERQNVTCLKELMLKAVTDRNYYLLSLLSAEKILEARRTGIF